MQKSFPSSFLLCGTLSFLAVGQAAAPVGANDKGMTLASQTKRLGKTVVYLKGEGPKRWMRFMRIDSSCGVVASCVPKPLLAASACPFRPKLPGPDKFHCARSRRVSHANDRQWIFL